MGARAIIFDLVLLFLLYWLGGLLHLLVIVYIVTEIKTVNAPMFKLKVFLLFFDFSALPVRGHGSRIVTAERLTYVRD